jgi:riboflavin kinase / FMN adenylyltransferase
MNILTLDELFNGDVATEKLGVTIGNFDGVHLGHQSLLSQIKSNFRSKEIKLLVITFVPHPMKVLKAKTSFLIHSYNNRRKLLEKNGVDYLVEVDFTRDFSSLDAVSFLENYLFKIKNLDSIYLGYDFAFGSNKQGGRNLVLNECKKRNIDIEIQPEFKEDNQLVSSSLIRNELEKGNVSRANEFLGRAFTITGMVVKGQGRGRQIGFPTANISFFEDKKIPKGGVYITRTKYRDQDYYSVTNIGINPTFSDHSVLSVETHILDFDNDIYGESLEISFLKNLREEKKFQSVNELINQIKIDVIMAREHFKS